MSDHHKRKFSETFLIPPTDIFSSFPFAFGQPDQQPVKYHQNLSQSRRTPDFKYLLPPHGDLIIPSDSSSLSSSSTLSSSSFSSSSSVPITPFRHRKRLGSPLEFDHSSLRPPKTLRRKKHQTATRDRYPVTTLHDEGFASSFRSTSFTSLPSVALPLSSLSPPPADVPLKNQLLHSLHLERMQRSKATSETKKPLSSTSFNHFSHPTDSVDEHKTNSNHDYPAIPFGKPFPSDTPTSSIQQQVQPEGPFHTSQLVFDPGASWGSTGPSIRSPFFRNKTSEDMDEGF